MEIKKLIFENRLKFMVNCVHSVHLLVLKLSVLQGNKYVFNILLYYKELWLLLEIFGITLGLRELLTFPAFEHPQDYLPMQHKCSSGSA